jgi:hypothetical protein
MRFAVLGFGFLRRSNTYMLVGVTTSYGLPLYLILGSIEPKRIERSL